MQDIHGFIPVSLLAAWLPPSQIIPGTERTADRARLIIEMARRHIGSFELNGTGSATIIRASGTPLLPYPAAHLGRPTLVPPSRLPRRLTFSCHPWEIPRILTEGWDVVLDSEEGHYITFRRSADYPPGGHQVDIRARATSRVGLQWAALPGGAFFTRGWGGTIPAYWARM